MLFLLLYICVLLANDGIYDNLDDCISSGIFKNGKFYIYSPAESINNITYMYIYDLKDCQISEINKTIVSITDAPYGYTPQFVNFAQDLKNEISSELWMIEKYLDLNVTDSKLDESKWTARFLNDKIFEFNPNFVKIPNYSNFPKGGFSQNVVNIDNNPVMYVVGGYTFSSEFNSTILTSYVFKYDFNTNNWSDLSEGSNSILPPIANHKSLLVNNSLFIINGVSPNTTDINYPQAYSTKRSMKLNAINKMHKFDLISEKWTEIPLKTNLDAGTYGDGVMYGASYDYYNRSIITYGSVEDINTGKPAPQFGSLSLTSYEWQWNPIKLEYGINNNLSLDFHQTLVIRDQLILFHGYTNQLHSRRIYVINLIDFKFKSILDYSGNLNSSESRPFYINITIGLGVTLGCSLLIACFIYYILYRKKKSRSLNNITQVDAIWAPSENVSEVFAPCGRAISDYQNCEIFAIDNTDALDNQIIKSRTTIDNLTCSTLVGTELDTKILSNNITNTSTKNKNF